MIYPIVIYGSQTLRNPSENIAPDYPDLAKLVEDMFLTLGEADGVGLAAPQIGKNIRLFVVDCTPWGEDHPELADYRRAFINAEIYERSEETSLFNEGCLSLPGLHEDVRRPVSIRMRYVDEKFVLAKVSHLRSKYFISDLFMFITHKQQTMVIHSKDCNRTASPILRNKSEFILEISNVPVKITSSGKINNFTKNKSIIIR